MAKKEDLKDWERKMIKLRKKEGLKDWKDTKQKRLRKEGKDIDIEGLKEGENEKESDKIYEDKFNKMRKK